MPAATTASPLFQVALGTTAHAVGLPVLDGEAVESIFPAAAPAGRVEDFALYRTEDWLVGSARTATGEDPEQGARRLYRALFQAAGDHGLARIWNYVPRINAAGSGGLENYRAFCRGRSLAFEEHFGPSFKRRLSSASAVGSEGDSLAVIFAATRQPLQHFENPQQIAAYDYPTEHGPRAPSFARATVVSGKQRRDVFISGTAAIRGHTSVTSGGIAAQLSCTLDNLRAIASACGAGADLGAAAGAERHLKVYLRHAADLPRVRATLGEMLLRPADRVSYVRADICRAELDVEIEATIFGLAKG